MRTFLPSDIEASYKETAGACQICNSFLFYNVIHSILWAPFSRLHLTQLYLKASPIPWACESKVSVSNTQTRTGVQATAHPSLKCSPQVSPISINKQLKTKVNPPNSSLFHHNHTCFFPSYKYISINATSPCASRTCLQISRTEHPRRPLPGCPGTGDLDLCSCSPHKATPCTECSFHSLVKTWPTKMLYLLSHPSHNCLWQSSPSVI